MNIDGSILEDIKTLKTAGIVKVSPVDVANSYLNEVYDMGLDDEGNPLEGHESPLSLPVLDMVEIQGIQDGVFNPLNDVRGYLYKGDIFKRKKNVKGEYILDDSGAHIMIKITVPNKCAAVLVPNDSLENIPLKYVSPTKGLFYIETMDVMVDKFEGSKPFRLVSIPKHFLYKVNLKSLIVGTKGTSTAMFQVKLTSPCFSSTSSAYGNSSTSLYLSIVDKFKLVDNNTTQQMINARPSLDDLKNTVENFLEYLTYAKLWYNIELVNETGSATYVETIDIGDDDALPEVEEEPMALPDEIVTQAPVALEGSARRRGPERVRRLTGNAPSSTSATVSGAVSDKFSFSDESTPSSRKSKVDETKAEYDEVSPSAQKVSDEMVGIGSGADDSGFISSVPAPVSTKTPDDLDMDDLLDGI